MFGALVHLIEWFWMRPTGWTLAGPQLTCSGRLIAWLLKSTPTINTHIGCPAYFFWSRNANVCLWEPHQYMAWRTFAGYCVFASIYPSCHHSWHQVHSTLLLGLMTIWSLTRVLCQVLNLVLCSHQLRIPTLKAQNSDQIFTVQQWVWMLRCCP